MNDPDAEYTNVTAFRRAALEAARSARNEAIERGRDMIGEPAPRAPMVGATLREYVAAEEAAKRPWDYIGDSPEWPAIEVKWRESKALFIRWAHEALLRRNLEYAAHCRSQAMHYHRRIQQRRLFPRP